MVGDKALERIKIRLPDAFDKEDLLNELKETVDSRLCLRLGVSELPSLFVSVLVDATVKMYRRVYYEGISMESADSISTSFVDDVLSEYDSEISNYKFTLEEQLKGRVKFL